MMDSKERESKEREILDFINLATVYGFWEYDPSTMTTRCVWHDVPICVTDGINNCDRKILICGSPLVVSPANKAYADAVINDATYRSSDLVLNDLVFVIRKKSPGALDLVDGYIRPGS